jgi:HAMP domain-containing protein
VDLAEAWVVLGLMRLALAVLSWRRVERGSIALVRAMAPGSSIGTVEDDARLGRAVRRAAVMVPGARCLAQATAGMILAARHGRRARVTIGVMLGAVERFGAHAWLETAHGVPIGGEEAAAFAPLMTIDPFNTGTGGERARTGS